MTLRGRWRPTPLEVALAVVMALWAGAPILFLVTRADGRVIDGGNGILGSGDQLQYMAWIRDEGRHLFAANLFDLTHDPHVFLHPMFVISGLLWRAGLPMQATYLIWLPIAIAVLLIGVAAYSRRMLTGHWSRAAVIALAVFYFSPVSPLVFWSGAGSLATRTSIDVVALETSPAVALWGYPATAIAIGLTPLFLLGVERVLEPKHGTHLSRALLLTSVTGLLVAWLHPWQGATLILAVAALAAIGRFERRFLVLLPVVAAVATPLLYFQLLGRLSPAWAMVNQPNSFPHVGLFLVALVPLVALGAMGFVGPAGNQQERLVRIWPFAALAVYAVLNRTFIYHAFEGLSIPMSVLGVRGLSNLIGQRRALKGILVVGLVAALTLPGMALAARYFTTTVSSGGEYYIGPDEAQALAFLSDSSKEGAVLARYYPGKDVPAFTGRNTWVGNYEWTPSFQERSTSADALFGGRMAPAAARELIARLPVAFVLTSCSDSSDFKIAVSPLASQTYQFGCATVYELKR